MACCQRESNDELVTFELGLKVLTEKSKIHDGLDYVGFMILIEMRKRRRYLLWKKQVSFCCIKRTHMKDVII